MEDGAFLSWHLALLHAKRWTDLYAFTLQDWLMMPSGIDTNLHQGVSKMPTFLAVNFKEPLSNCSRREDTELALREQPLLLCRFIAAGGCAVHFVGYFAVWATAKGIVQMPFWLLAAFALCGSAAVVFFDAAAIVCSMRNFPTERGNTAGLRS